MKSAILTGCGRIRTRWKQGSTAAYLAVARTGQYRYYLYMYEKHDEVPGHPR